MEEPKQVAATALNAADRAIVLTSDPDDLSLLCAGSATGIVRVKT